MGNRDKLIPCILQAEESSKARPVEDPALLRGCDSFTYLGLDYVLFQTWLFKYTALVIGLGQGVQ